MKENRTHIAARRERMKGRVFRTALFIAAALFLLNAIAATSQTYKSSPANWMFPDGNSAGTRFVSKRSATQPLDSFIVKWSSGEIFGDVKPLIGNVINDEKIFYGFQYAPNEIVAVIGDTVVIVDAAGRSRGKTETMNYVRGVSALYDRNATDLTSGVQNPCVIAFETNENQNLKDTLAFAYVGQYDENPDTVKTLMRLAIDLRDFAPNYFASIKPIFGRKIDSEDLIFATVNMTKPSAPDPFFVSAPFFRGFAQFNTNYMPSQYPLADVGDDIEYRVTLGPEVNFSQPTMHTIDGGKIGVFLPCLPSPWLDTLSSAITNPVTLGTTNPETPYLIGLELNNGVVAEEILLDLSTLTFDGNRTRPHIKPYYINITNANTGDDLFLLLAEGYSGIDGSQGKPRLHLYEAVEKNGGNILPGDPLTTIGDFNFEDPPFEGDYNHLWSIAVGDVDGRSSNQALPYYPNYPGNELIVTQSSRDFSVAANTLYILRYYDGDLIDKPSPPNTYLYEFDTIATTKINGWVAAVNDIDGGDDQKCEIFLVDGGKLKVLRMKDYSDVEFQTGDPFEVVFEREFKNQTISNVSIADLEGDGMNDVVVTTYDSTYALGSLIDNIIEITFPAMEIYPPIEYCVRDTVDLTWINHMRSEGDAIIYFQEIQDGLPVGDTLTEVARVDNNRDTIVYYYVVDSLTIGKSGVFVVANEFFPTKIYDVSAMVKFTGPTMEILDIDYRTYIPGDELEIEISGTCLDSIRVEYGYSATYFEPEPLLLEEYPQGADKTAIKPVLPCVNFFNCSPPDEDSVLYTRIISFKKEYSDTTDAIPIKMKPAPFTLEYNISQTADPTKFFKWDVGDIDFPCDTVSFLVSINNGASFTHLASIAAGEMNYKWNIPIELPNSVIARFCCEQSCVRLDTLIENYQPRYLNIIAPNPYRPVVETLEIIYHVPAETNVTIRIYDQNNRIVAEPVSNAHRLPGIAYADHWNGEIKDGSYAANGVYYVALELSSGVKEVHPVFVRN